MTKLLPAMAGETCSPAPSAAARGRIDQLSRSERRPQSLRGARPGAAPHRGMCGAAPPRPPRAGGAAGAGAARSGAEPPRRGLGAGRLPQVSVRRRRRRRAPPARSCSLAPSPAAWAESY